MGLTRRGEVEGGMRVELGLLLRQRDDTEGPDGDRRDCIVGGRLPPISSLGVRAVSHQPMLMKRTGNVSDERIYFK